MTRIAWVFAITILALACTLPVARAADEQSTSSLLPGADRMPQYEGVSWRAMRYDLPKDDRNDTTGAVTSGMYYWAAEVFVDVLKYEKQQLLELESQARPDAEAIRSARDRIAKLELLPPDDLQFRSMVHSSAIDVVITLTYHPNPDRYLDDLQQCSPVFANATSADIGTRSLRSPRTDVYSCCFTRCGIIANVMVSRGNDKSIAVDPAVCGSAIARGLDGILSGSTGDFTTRGSDASRSGSWVTGGGASSGQETMASDDTPTIPTTDRGNDATTTTTDRNDSAATTTDRGSDSPTSDGRAWTIPAGADWCIAPNTPIAEAVICERERDRAPYGIACTFKKETAEVTLIARTKPGDHDISVWVDWYHEGRQARRDVFSAPPNATFYVSIIPGEGDYLRPGKYRVEIKAESEKVGTLSFEILRGNDK